MTLAICHQPDKMPQNTHLQQNNKPQQEEDEISTLSKATRDFPEFNFTEDWMRWDNKSVKGRAEEETQCPCVGEMKHRGIRLSDFK